MNLLKLYFEMKCSIPPSIKMRYLIQNNFKETMKDIRLTIFNPPSSYFVKNNSFLIL